MKDINIYAAADKAIKAMDRENVEAFGRLKAAKWDEVNVIQTVKAVYAKADKQARKRYYEVAFEAYLLGMAMCGTEPKKAHQMAEKAITEEWVEKVLYETDFVTLYRYDTELERKAYRLAEALETGINRNAEVDKALRFLSMMLAQYAINMTDYAMILAFQDCGVEMVEWVSRRDGRVCSECHAYNGQVFRIDEIPPKHFQCRCHYKPVFRAAEDSEVAADPEKPQ